jgi:hypothetical protein
VNEPNGDRTLRPSRRSKDLHRNLAFVQFHVPSLFALGGLVERSERQLFR